jgi:hypothetical protein
MGGGGFQTIINVYRTWSYDLCVFFFLPSFPNKKKPEKEIHHKVRKGTILWNLGRFSMCENRGFKYTHLDSLGLEIVDYPF